MNKIYYWSDENTHYKIPVNKVQLVILREYMKGDETEYATNIHMDNGYVIVINDRRACNELTQLLQREGE